MKDRSSATFLLVVSLLFFILLCLTAAACGSIGSVQLASTGDNVSMTSILMFVFGILWCSLLLVPTIWYAIRRLRGHEAQPGPFSGGWTTWLPYGLMLVVYPLVLFTGIQISKINQLAWWLVPVLQIPAATLPVFWLSGLALRRLSSESQLQRWGVFGLGLTLGPALIMVFELSVILVLFLIFAIRMGSDQSQAIELMLLAQRLQYATPDPGVIFGILHPYILRPSVLMIVFGFIAILVPLIEETIKPIGVWLLAGKDINPAQGFAAGALSGAGYALFENLFITAPGSQWAAISIGRIGTSTMHILTAGLTGYALAGAWKHGRYLRLGLVFGLSVLLHAFWNGLILLSLTSILPTSFGLPVQIAKLGQISAAALMGLYVLVFMGLLFFNRRMRRYAIIAPPELPELSPEVQPVETTAEEKAVEYSAESDSDPDSPSTT